MEPATGVMESIVILDDDEEEGDKAHPSSSSSHPFASPRMSKVTVPAPTHITQSPFASSKKESHILLLENQKLFQEFVEHCQAHTKDHPEVIPFLQSKHTKASPDFLASVELRNTLGRCLTRAQACPTKTFVYINELCTVLKQHAAKRRQVVTATTKKEEGNVGGPEGPQEPQEELPSTSGPGGQKKAPRASKRQIAYLENLLKVYYEEIRHLQEQEISLDGMMEEDSSYIQEHKLKRKVSKLQTMEREMMKIYDKLCELKGCTTLTGRVIEQRVSYRGSRYPEINRKIERLINSPESQQNPPDYSDILRAVQRANERHGLSLTRKQVAQLAQDAFRDTGNQLQERRHLDMVYNFGCHLTDAYKPALDPALSDLTLHQKLRSNRELALSNLSEVITEYAVKQDDVEEEERRKRLEKMKNEATADGQEVTPLGDKEKDGDNGEGAKSNGEEEEDDEEEEDESSDPDIEEELAASKSQEGADDREEDVEEEEATNESDKEQRLGSGHSSSPEAMEMNGKEDSQSASSSQGDIGEGNLPSVKTENVPTPLVSPSQSETADLGGDSLNGASGSASPDHPDPPALSPCPEACLPSSCTDSRSAACSPLTRNPDSLPPSPAADLADRDSLFAACDSRSASTSPRQPSPRVVKSPNPRKRRRKTESSPESALNGGHKRSRDSDDDIPLDMGVVTSSPLQADSTLTDSPTQELVSSSQFTPSPRNKVSVATQCDPDEVIILSDSD